MISSFRKMPAFLYNRMWMKIRKILGLALLSLILLSQPVMAQSGGRIFLDTPNADLFPTVSLLLKAYDETGASLNDLNLNEMTVIEDQKPLTPRLLEQVQPGIQFIVAINASPVLANRYAGVTQFEAIQTALREWVSRQPAESNDDYSLSTNTGLQAIRLRQPSAFDDALASYNPDLLKTPASLVSLTQAVDLLQDPNPRQSMNRVVLYITALPTLASAAGIQTQTERAAKSGARIWVWLVGAENSSSLQAAQPLLEMSMLTNGAVLPFTGAQPLPDLEEYLLPLRFIYRLTYDSAINTPGDHRVSLQLKRGDFEVQSPVQRFNIQVLPPNPIFLSPPQQVVRKPAIQSNLPRFTLFANSTDEPGRLTPDQVVLNILVEFPDQHPRPLVASRLLVNGEVVQENKQPPFDILVWNIPDDRQSTTYDLQAEVEDSLGLQQRTITTQIQVVVDAPEVPNLVTLVSRERLIAGGAILASGLVLLLVLLRAGKRISQDGQKNRRERNDPVTQPVNIHQEASHLASTQPLRKSATQPGVRLVRLGENARPAGQVVAITENEITLGSDPQQAMCVLDDETINPLHARLYKTAEGEYKLSDEGIIAGTWVNYSPVTSAGVRLEHGDLIHFGRAVYRFELNGPERVRQLTITPNSEERR
jgi:hypothetical protein